MRKGRDTRKIGSAWPGTVPRGLDDLRRASYGTAVALGRGAVLAGMTVLETCFLAVPLSAIVVPALRPALLMHGSLIGVYLWGWLVPGIVLAEFGGRRVLGLHRRLATGWCGVDIPTPYRPRPLMQLTEHGWYWNGYDYHKYRWLSRWQQQIRWVQRDPATWRDLAWQIFGPLLGGLPALLPTLLIAAGLGGVLTGILDRTTDWHPWFAAVALACAPANLLLGVLLARPAVLLHGRGARFLLAPTERARLTQRVQRLTETRTDAVDAQAAELRRIERDLHDGAQARLVAMGLTLGAIERLLDTDPAAARELLARTREASAQALSELRDLVRGIHPPVLAERGLGDAVRALALDCPLHVTVGVAMQGQLGAPVESAAYFATCEALTNVTKHAGASAADITVRHDGTSLRIVVSDDGHGGVDESRGTGLRGIRRRLGTFDGTLTVHSPAGGPTTVTMEIPCALSLPRTSTSSGKV